MHANNARAMAGKVVRIGAGSGFWGDSVEGPRQLVLSGKIDYLIGDYLAEITMSILARAKARKPEMGYAPDFLTYVIKPLAKEIAARGIKVIVNAGGVNPLACKDELVRELSSQGVALRVAAVHGDDVTPLLGALRQEKTREIASDEPIPEDVLTANAYLGAFPIAAALAAGADIVVTGRCVDSALALGPLIHEFGWKPDNFERLAAGSLVGHVIECGPQCTGGIYTDWREVADGWANIGFPIAECFEDGSFVLTKPAGTGGRVCWGTVAEQVTYETDDPRAYLLPDVVCDFSQVVLEEIGPDRVHLRGARGRPCTSTYKVSATYQDGFRSLGTLFVKGIEAVPKARAVAAAILSRTRSILERERLGEYTQTSIEVLGAEDTYGPHARMKSSREVVLKIGVRHPSKRALEIFSREIAPATTGMGQGLAGVMDGRPNVQPVLRLYSFLIEKARLTVEVSFEGRTIPVPIRAQGEPQPRKELGVDPVTAAEAQIHDENEKTTSVPLVALAFGRSGDKGDVSNIAILARKEAFVPVIARQLTAEAVAEYMAHVVRGPVQRFEWPGLRGFNFVLHNALAGGGTLSLRYDPQGKAHAQMLMDFLVSIPTRWIEEGHVHLN